MKAWIAYAIALYIEYPRPIRRLMPALFLLLVLFVSCVATACAPVIQGDPKPVLAPASDTTKDEEPMEYPAPFFYQRWWHNVEQCSGLTGDLATIQWYVAPRGLLMIPNVVGLFAGIYIPVERKVLFGLFEPGDSTVVHHEMLHALIDINNKRRPYDPHPLEYFKDKCGKIVGPGGMG